MENLRVTVSELRAGDESTIPESAIDIRLATYWNLGHPRYTSRSTYRRVPELLEKVATHSSPAFECQRWWITIHVPPRTPPGIYRGQIVFHGDPVQRATILPIRFRVLGFGLLSDPNKHYSTYFGLKNQTQYQGKSDEETRRMLDGRIEMPKWKEPGIIEFLASLSGNRRRRVAGSRARGVSAYSGSFAVLPTASFPLRARPLNVGFGSVGLGKYERDTAKACAKKRAAPHSTAEETTLLNRRPSI